jgi:hypothetical protein
MSINDSGHLGNLTGFDHLITAVKGYPPKYNPSRSEFTPAALDAKYAVSKIQNANYNLAESSNTHILDQRVVTYKTLNRLITNSFNSLKSSGLTPMVIEEVAQIVRKLKGQRAGKKPLLSPKAEGEPEPKQNSVSQLTFDERLNNFDKYIRRLEQIPQYDPNEEEITISALRAFYTILDESNKAAKSSKNMLDNVRIARGVEFYDKTNGLVTIGKETKLYIRSVFGANSPEFRQVSGITFKMYKN